MRLLASFKGRRGDIVIFEDRSTGARSYYEEDVFQSYATPDGVSLFAYVHLLLHLLHRANDVLLLGCAAGSLATMLHRQGKRVTVVDDNELSFVIAREFFGMPKGIICVSGDFGDFVLRERATFDGIGIDIGAPIMCFDRQFDADACRAIRSQLGCGGRIAMNMLRAHDLDRQPDRILSMLAARDLRGWLYDQPGEPDRNIVLSAVPEIGCPSLPSSLHTSHVNVEQVDWRIKRPQPFKDAALNALPTAMRAPKNRKSIIAAACAGCGREGRLMSIEHKVREVRLQWL